MSDDTLLQVVQTRMFTGDSASVARARLLLPVARDFDAF